MLNFIALYLLIGIIWSLIFYEKTEVGPVLPSKNILVLFWPVFLFAFIYGFLMGVYNDYFRNDDPWDGF